jgi:hypothetical protein
VYFHADFTFVPPWLEDEDYESEHRTMNVMVNGSFPGLNNWRDLEGYGLESREAIVTLGEEVSPEMEGPEIQIWSSGKGTGSIHTHAKDGWETRLDFKELIEDEHGPLFICEVEAFFPSERARKASVELWMKEFFGETDFSDLEKARIVEEGWRLNFCGRLRFGHASCSVPLNTSDPIGWAQRLATRELAIKEFGLCRVNGGESDGSWKPADGVTANGRLVLVSPMTPWFREWQFRQKVKERERDERQGEGSV